MGRRGRRRQGAGGHRTPPPPPRRRRFSLRLFSALVPVVGLVTGGVGGHGSLPLLVRPASFDAASAAAVLGGHGFVLGLVLGALRRVRRGGRHHAASFLGLLLAALPLVLAFAARALADDGGLGEIANDARNLEVLVAAAIGGAAGITAGIGVASGFDPRAPSAGSAGSATGERVGAPYGPRRPEGDEDEGEDEAEAGPDGEEEATEPEAPRLVSVAVVVAPLEAAAGATPAAVPDQQVWVGLTWEAATDAVVTSRLLTPVAGTPVSAPAAAPGGSMDLPLGDLAAPEPGSTVEVETSIAGGGTRVDAGVVPGEPPRKPALLGVRVDGTLVDPGTATAAARFRVVAVVSADVPDGQTASVVVAAPLLGTSGALTLTPERPEGEVGLGEHGISGGAEIDVQATLGDQQASATWTVPHVEPPPPEEEPAEEDVDEEDATWAGWSHNVARDTLVGAVQDLHGIPRELERLATWAGKARDEAIEVLSDPESWRVGLETTGTTLRDLGRLAALDPAFVQELLGRLGVAADMAARVAAALWEKARKDPAGAVAGFLGAILGVENWEKVVSKDVGLLERWGRALWGAVDLGGTLWGAGTAVEAGASKLGGWVRGTEAATDAARALDRGAEAAKVLEEGADAAKVLDEGGDAAKVLDEGGDAARALDEGADAAHAADVPDHPRPRGPHEPEPPPPVATGRDAALRNLEPGTPVPDELVPQTGYTREQIDELARVAREENVIVGSRSTNMDSARHIAAGEARPKPVHIKAKTINEADTYLGAAKGDEGLVGYFEPKKPDLDAVPERLREEVAKRYEARMKEFEDLREDVDRMIADKRIVEEDGKLWHAIDGQREKPFAGDIDAVYLKDAETGEYLTGSRYDRVLAKLKASGAQLQHGAEVNQVNDVMKGVEAGSAGYQDALDHAVELAGKLEQSHVRGAEVVLEVHPDGLLRRGPRLTHLPMEV